MNIAFPALLIFLLFLPGLFWTMAFYNTDSEPLNYVPLTYKAMVSFFATFLLHMFWLSIMNHFPYFQINLREMLVLISGAQSPLYTSTIKAINVSEIKSIVIYFVTIYAFAYALGKSFNYIVLRFKLDRFKIFRFDNVWYYLFKGYELENIEPDGVIISAVMEFAGQGYLYQGYLESFFYDKEGNLDRLVLTDASRRKIESDKSNPENQSTETRFYPIDGDYFVLKYSEIKNLNVQFLKFQLKSQTSPNT